MSDSIIIIKKNEPLTTSLIVAEKLNRKHDSITKLIETYEKSFKNFGVLGFEILKPKKGSKGGRPTKFYYLNEQQLTFLIMNMKVLKKDNDKVLEFKERITKEFFNMRKWILEQQTQKANEEYLEVRKQSKIGRRQETDVIKEFVEYATKQGSNHAYRYYSNISTMENKAFFILKEKFKNVREILNITQLNKIIFADIIVKQALIEGMEKGMKYNHIYQLAKERVLQAAGTLPKEILPGIEFKQIGMMENQIEKKTN